MLFHNFFIVHDIHQTLYFKKINWNNSSILSKYFCHKLFKVTPFMNSKLGNFLNFFSLNSHFCLNFAIQIILINSNLYSTYVPIKTLVSDSFISNKNGYSDVKTANLLILVVQRFWQLMCFNLDQTSYFRIKKVDLCEIPTSLTIAFMHWLTFCVSSSFRYCSSSKFCPIFSNSEIFPYPTTIA